MLSSSIQIINKKYDANVNLVPKLIIKASYSLIQSFLYSNTCQMCNSHWSLRIQRLFKKQKQKPLHLNKHSINPIRKLLPGKYVPHPVEESLPYINHILLQSLQISDDWKPAGHHILKDSQGNIINKATSFMQAIINLYFKI